MVFDLIIDYRADLDEVINYYKTNSMAKATRLYNAIQDAYTILKENLFF